MLVIVSHWLTRDEIEAFSVVGTLIPIPTPTKHLCFGTLFLKACKVSWEHPPSQLRFYNSIISSYENVQVIDSDHPYFDIFRFDVLQDDGIVL